jgi:hypothetical protein
LLILGPRTGLIKVFTEELDRQHSSQQELLEAGRRLSLKEVRENLLDEVATLRKKYQECPSRDKQHYLGMLRDCEDHLEMNIHVSGPGRDTAPRGIVARVACRVLRGYSVLERCSARDCGFKHQLAICSLCSHMVCQRHLPTVKQTRWNKSAWAECRGP